MGPAPTNGLGPSQGHRRRRRRRKNKSSQPGAPQAQPQQVQQAPPPQQQSGQPKAPHMRQNQGRKKKKFFQKGGGGGGGQGPQPGNSINGSNNGRRKDRQKGPRMFVGPMDHSYRTVNGNVADGPPSTIPTSSNGHGSYYPDVYQAIPPAPVREDAPTREGAKPTLVVFDLNNLNAKPLALIPKFKTKFKKATSIIGFLNHLQGDLKAKAVEAGCDTVMPRSAFSQSLPNLLRRYGLEEEDESIAQPMG
jgi:hypothetical protein